MADHPIWDSDRVVDPDSDMLWLAVDTYPTLAAAQAEAGDNYEPFDEQPDHLTLRWADAASPDDEYAVEEWGATTIAEPCPADEGRAFWSFGSPATVASSRSHNHEEGDGS